MALSNNKRLGGARGASGRTTGYFTAPPPPPIQIAQPAPASPIDQNIVDEGNSNGPIAAPNIAPGLRTTADDSAAPGAGLVGGRSGGGGRDGVAAPYNGPNADLSANDISRGMTAAAGIAGPLAIAAKDRALYGMAGSLGLGGKLVGLGADLADGNYGKALMSGGALLGGPVGLAMGIGRAGYDAYQGGWGDGPVPNTGAGSLGARIATYANDEAVRDRVNPDGSSDVFFGGTKYTEAAAPTQMQGTPEATMAAAYAQQQQEARAAEAAAQAQAQAAAQAASRATPTATSPTGGGLGSMLGGRSPDSNTAAQNSAMAASLNGAGYYGGGGGGGGGGEGGGRATGGSGGDASGGGDRGTRGGFADGGLIDQPVGLSMSGYADGGEVGQPLLSMGFAGGGPVQQGGMGADASPQMIEMRVNQLVRNPQFQQRIMQAIQPLMQSGELTPQEVTTMGQIAMASMQNPKLYPQLRQFVASQGMTPLPPAYDPSTIMKILSIARVLEQTGGGMAAPGQGQPTPAGQIPPTSQAQMSNPTGAPDGGYLQGPGTGRSDSIGTQNLSNGGPVKVSNGEYVIPEHVVRAKGRDFFDALLRRYSEVPKAEG